MDIDPNHLPEHFDQIKILTRREIEPNPEIFSDLHPLRQVDQQSSFTRIDGPTRQPCFHIFGIVFDGKIDAESRIFSSLKIDNPVTRFRFFRLVQSVSLYLSPSPRMKESPLKQFMMRGESPLNEIVRSEAA
jgi:hypothetical protein